MFSIHSSLGALQSADSISKSALQCFPRPLQLPDAAVDGIVTVPSLLSQISLLLLHVALKGFLLAVQVADSRLNVLISPPLLLENVSLIVQSSLSTLVLFLAKRPLGILHGGVKLSSRLLHVLLGSLAGLLKRNLGLIDLALGLIDAFVNRSLGAGKPLLHRLRDLSQDALLQHSVELKVAILEVDEGSGTSLVGNCILDVAILQRGCFRLDQLAVDLEPQQGAPRQLKVELELWIGHDLCLDEHAGFEVPERHAAADFKALMFFGDLKVNERVLTLRAIGSLPSANLETAQLEALHLALELEALTPDAAVDLDLLVQNESFALHHEAWWIDLSADDAPERACIDIDVLEADDFALWLVNVEFGNGVDQVNNLSGRETCRFDFYQRLLWIGTEVECQIIFVHVFSRRATNGKSAREPNPRGCPSGKKLLIDDLYLESK